MQSLSFAHEAGCHDASMSWRSFALSMLGFGYGPMSSEYELPPGVHQGSGSTMSSALGSDQCHAKVARTTTSPACSSSTRARQTSAPRCTVAGRCFSTFAAIVPVAVSAILKQGNQHQQHRISRKQGDQAACTFHSARMHHYRIMRGLVDAATPQAMPGAQL